MDTFAQLTIFLVILIILAKLAVILSSRLGMPGALLQLFTGVLLGPSLFNLFGSPIILGTWGSASPTPLHGALKALSEIGLIQLMFLAGLKTNWRELGKNIKPILSVAAWGFGISAISVALVSRWFVERSAEAMGLGATMAASSFGISIHNLMEANGIGPQTRSMVAGVGALTGLFAMLMMIASLATNYGVTFGGFKAFIAVSWFLGKLIMFFALSYFLMSRYLNRIAKIGFERRPLQTLIGYLLLVAAVYAWGAVHFGSFAAVLVSSLGGGLLGIHNIEMREKISRGFGSPLAAIPVGLFFVTLGMEVNLRESLVQWPFLCVVLMVVAGAKWVGSWIATCRDSEQRSDRVSIMVGSLPQGEMGMLIAAYCFSRGVLTPSSFNIAITVVVLLTMVVPILMVGRRIGLGR